MVFPATASAARALTVPEPSPFPGGARRLEPLFVPVQAGFPPYYDGTLAPSWGDEDNDGDLDLPLYRNDGDGTFSEIPGFRDLLAGGNYHGSAWADYDGDGHLDLFILPYGADSQALLLHNRGDGTFENVAPALGMNVSGYGETAVWGDFDGDGRVDLFAPYYAHVYPFHSFLWHNNGDGTFTDVSDSAHVSLRDVPVELRPEGATAADWDGDGDLDLYCASHFFVNDGHGVFTDERAEVGLPVAFDEGAAFVDFDNDGDFDLYIRGMDSPHLWRNDGGHFHEVTGEAGLGPVPVFWGDSWADVDNDGDLDLLYFVGAGVGHLMLNQGDGTFVEDTSLAALGLSKGLSAWGDFDGDGDLDLIAGVEQAPTLLENELNTEPGFANSYLRIMAVDATGCESEQGATIRLERVDGVPGGVQTRVVGGGSTYLNQGEYAAHFGVAATGVYALSVAFPSSNGGRVVDWTTNPALGAIEPDRVESGTLEVSSSGEVIGGVSPVAAGFQLGPPRPNPFRSRTSIAFTAPHEERMKLAVYDVSGRCVKTLLNGVVSAGTHFCVWRGRDARGRSLPSGVYILCLTSEGGPVSREVVMIR